MNKIDTLIDDFISSNQILSKLRNQHVSNINDETLDLLIEDNETYNKFLHILEVIVKSSQQTKVFIKTKVSIKTLTLMNVINRILPLLIIHYSSVNSTKDLSVISESKIVTLIDYVKGIMTVDDLTDIYDRILDSIVYYNTHYYIIHDCLLYIFFKITDDLLLQDTYTLKVFAKMCILNSVSDILLDRVLKYIPDSNIFVNEVKTKYKLLTIPDNYTSLF